MSGTNYLFDLFAAASPARDSIFIDLPDGQAVSFGALFDLSARMANVLTERGLEPGDRVAVQTEKSWQTLALYLATLRAGGVYLPLNSAYTRSEIA